MSQYLEDRVRELEDNLDNLKKIVTNIVNIIKPGHTDNYCAIKNKDLIKSKAFTKNYGSCLCKNKWDHHPRCMPRLIREHENRCDCGFKEVRKVLTGGYRDD